MQIRPDRSAGSQTDTDSGRTVRIRESVLSQLRQLGMNVEDDNLLADLDTLDENGLIAVLGLFGLLGYYALLGLLGTQDTEADK